jgi:hypothetical protein
MMYNDRVRDAWENLSVPRQEILSADLAGDDEVDDEEIATRLGTTAAAVRVERSWPGGA